MGVADARDAVAAQLVRRRDRHARHQDRRDGMLRDRVAGLSASALEPGAQGARRLLGKPCRPAGGRTVRGPQGSDVTRRLAMVTMALVTGILVPACAGGGPAGSGAPGQAMVTHLAYRYLTDLTNG